MDAVTSVEAWQESYRRMVDEYGELVTLRRYTGTGESRTKFDAEVRARVTDYTKDELVGSIQQGDRKVIVLAEDLITELFPLPLVASDKVVVRGRELAILAPDDSTRRIGTTLIAYELTARG
jgi:hypothetical protein